MGCGAGIETRALLRAGWRVHATDAAPGTPERVLAATDEADHRRLTVELTDLRTLPDLPRADLIYAGYSLPYVGPDHLPAVWRLIRTRLRPGAWLGVNLFGERDSWAGSADEAFLDVSAARALFDGLDVLRFTEVEEDGPAYSGTKHWHTFDVIARRPPR
jgi:trans-aconitate methyltransferase